MGYYLINQAGGAKLSDDFITDFDEVLDRLNEAEVALGVVAEGSETTYRTILDTEGLVVRPHMAVSHATLGDTHLREVIDWMRATMEVEAFAWGSVPAAADFGTWSWKEGMNRRWIVEFFEAIGRVEEFGGANRTEAIMVNISAEDGITYGEPHPATFSSFVNATLDFQTSQRNFQGGSRGVRNTVTPCTKTVDSAGFTHFHDCGRQYEMILNEEPEETTLHLSGGTRLHRIIRGEPGGGSGDYLPFEEAYLDVVREKLIGGSGETSGFSAAGDPTIISDTYDLSAEIRLGWAYPHNGNYLTNPFSHPIWGDPGIPLQGLQIDTKKVDDYTENLEVFGSALVVRQTDHGFGFDPTPVYDAIVAFEEDLTNTRRTEYEALRDEFATYNTERGLPYVDQIDLTEDPGGKAHWRRPNPIDIGIADNSYLYSGHSLSRNVWAGGRYNVRQKIQRLGSASGVRWVYWTEATLPLAEGWPNDEFTN